MLEAHQRLAVLGPPELSGPARVPSTGMSVTLPTPAAPVIRFVVLVPARAPNKAMQELATREAVSEVLAALNRWAYECPAEESVS